MLDTEMIRQRLGSFALGLALAALVGAPCGAAPAGAARQSPQPGTMPKATPPKSAVKETSSGMDRLPQPASGQALDIAAVARGFDAAGAAAAAQALVGGPQLLVFVSLTMPQGSLRRLFEQAERSRAVLVLRGLKDGSMVNTAVTVRELLGNHKTDIQIDPQGFDRFGINQVPTFVLLKDGAQLQRCADTSCIQPASYVEVSGDVTIDYALDWIGAKSSTLNREAQQLLHRLRE